MYTYADKQKKMTDRQTEKWPTFSLAVCRTILTQGGR